MDPQITRLIATFAALSVLLITLAGIPTPLPTGTLIPTLTVTTETLARDPNVTSQPRGTPTLDNYEVMHQTPTDATYGFAPIDTTGR